jgi:hypothetical protein
MFSFYFKQCHFCGKRFMALSKKQKYCSDECKKARAKRRRDYRKGLYGTSKTEEPKSDLKEQECQALSETSHP